MKSIILCLLFVTLFASCEYTPTGTNQRTIPLPVNDVDLLLLDEQALSGLRGNVMLSYASLLHGKEFVSIEIDLNDTLCAFSTSPTGSIPINTTRYPDGGYAMTVTLVTSTNSGSLADRLGREIFVFQKQYRVYIFNAPVEPPRIRRFRNANGALEITWSRYNQPGFREYVLEKSGSGALDVIIDVNDTTATDMSCVGGAGLYKVTVVVGGYWYDAGDTLYRGVKTEFASYAVVDSSKIRLAWHRNSFDAAFGKYRLYRIHPCPHSHTDLLAELSAIEDTSFVDENPLFGADGSYRIEILPNTGTMSTIGGELMTAALGNPFVPITSHFEYIPSVDRFYAICNTYLYLIDGHSLQILASSQILRNQVTEPPASDVSGNGRFLYYIQDYETTEVLKLNPSTFAIEQTVRLRDLLPSTPTALAGICVSDSNMLYAVLQYGGADIRLQVFDMTVPKLITSAPTSEVPYNLEITGDGRFVIHGTSLFRFAGDSLSRVGTIEANARFLNDGVTFVQFVNHRLQVLQCADAAVINEVAFPAELYDVTIDVDQATGLVGLHSSAGEFSIVRALPAQIFKALNVTGFGFRYQHGFIFGNNRSMRVTL